MTCFEMYARELPWAGGETLEAVVQHINVPPKELRKLVPGVEPQVADTIMRGLALQYGFPIWRKSVVQNKGRSDEATLRPLLKILERTEFTLCFAGS